MMNAMKYLPLIALMAACADVEPEAPSNMPSHADVYAASVETQWTIHEPAIAHRLSPTASDVAEYVIRGSAIMARPGADDCEVATLGTAFSCADGLKYCPSNPVIGLELMLRVGIRTPEPVLTVEDGYFVCSYPLDGKRIWLRK
jgi:hypothetical protein